MKIGVIADDFTGASDIALTLAEAGMSVAQFIGVPRGAADADLGAGVVALKSRTAPVDDAVSQSLAACDWLIAQGATQIILKVCSTFDSTAQGNIGPVLDALAVKLGAETVIVCPAFPENGRSVYMGHLFVADGLLSESGMENHPLTPMTDPDLRRVLGAQSTRDTGHIDAMTVLKGAGAIRASMTGTRHLITDAISDRDLFEIGKAADGAKLLCGGSGIALGLPANFGVAVKPPSWVAIKGHGVVFSGSCSRATREQVERFGAIAPSYQIDADRAVADGYAIDEIVDWVLAQDVPPLIYSSANPETVRAAQERHGSGQAADAIEGLFARLAPALVAKGVRRVVVAGGETSGAVVTGLGADILTIGPRAAAGVPLVTSNGTALALKSGNFGEPDFFAKTLTLMEKPV
ncbi:four-carbon acid sugar kinase family protein [Epibacterium ulvae]|uniref:3-oxo-tetronate kinase n=1 Tax=Epibacterium ulvae TaxID=1156985 RepID=UPI001BFC2EED|nr:3-oxo-tetronate kinase [Epibacterium ulvae]MBT8155123.1 four-carbon acid sugar kinase family protein [Epibacterium ulvae]